MSDENLTSDNQTQQANIYQRDVVMPDGTRPEQEQTAQLNDQHYTESNNNYIDIPQGTQNADNCQNRTQLVVTILKATCYSLSTSS